MTSKFTSTKNSFSINARNLVLSITQVRDKIRSILFTIAFFTVLFTISTNVHSQPITGYQVCPCGVVIAQTQPCPCTTYYNDADSDGFGNPNQPRTAVIGSTTPGLASNSLDCNDNDNTIYPGAPELCDGKDNDCNGIIEDNSSPTVYFFDGDGDGYGNAAVSAFFSCNIPANYVKDNTDCNDNNPSILGSVKYYRDVDLDGFGDPNNSLRTCNGQPIGYVTNKNDCNDQNGLVNQFFWVKDADGDGTYIGNPLSQCTSPGQGYVIKTNQQPGDCNDNDPQNRTVIYVNRNAVGIMNDGSSWANAFKTLQDALVNTTGCITQIWVAAGTYYPDEGGNEINNNRSASFVMKNGITLYGGFSGTETSLGQRNWKLYKTILSGDIDQNDGENFANNSQNSNSVIISPQSINNTAIIDGFGVTAGNETTGSGGGGISCEFSKPLIRNCNFFANQSFSGGAIYNYRSSPKIINTSFIGNYSIGYGGAISLDDGTSEFINCTFNNNKSARGDGGTLYIVRPGDHSFINCTFNLYSKDILKIIDNDAYVQPSLNFTNCILWGADQPVACRNGTGFYFCDNVTATNSIIGGISGNSNSYIDPQFVDAANGDFHLMPGSPAINAGSDAANNELFDLDGYSRKVRVIDMGAFENLPCSLSLVSATLPEKQVAGCNETDVIKSGLAYTTTPAQISLAQFTAAGGAIVPGGCTAQTITYTDILDVFNNKLVHRTFSLLYNGGITALCTQDIRIQTPSLAATISPQLQSICLNTVPQTLSLDFVTSGSTTIKWYSSPSSDFTEATEIFGVTNPFYTPPSSNIAGDTYYFARIVDNCGGVARKIAKVTVTGNVEWVLDKDGDNFYTGNVLISCTSPGNGYMLKSNQEPGDCNDNNATVHAPVVYYVDVDKDGFGSTTMATLCSSTVPTGYSTNNSDCDDNDATVNAPVQYYVDKDHDGFGSATTVMLCSSTAPVGYATNNTDCNDNDAALSPQTFWLLDADGDGYHQKDYYVQFPSCTPPQDGKHYINISKGSDCDDSDPSYNPETVWVMDADGDGYYTGEPYIGCFFIFTPGYVRKTNQQPGDCVDNNAAINPGATEILDELDNNCNGVVDDIVCISVIVTKNITAQLTPGGNVIITPAQVNNGSSNTCGALTLSLDKTTFYCNNIGANTVTLTGVDVNGNQASATAIVTVEDKALPTVITKNITAQIDAGGIAVIADRDVDNGSYDACGLVLYKLDKTKFYCNNVGQNTVTLTVTDANGNQASGTAIVTVEDHALPTVITKNIIAQIDAGGIAVIADRDVDNGSYDACGLVLYKLDKTSFYCNNVGPNTVTLTVTDANGNQASGTAIVTVEDHALPTVITKNITVQLDATGSVTVSDRAVDNGSYDACGLILYKLDKTTFTCFNVGDNTVTLTVTDANGNKASGTAIITVQGNGATSWILDNDADGYYPGNPVTACTSPGAGYIVKTTQQAGDCDDANRALNPATVWFEDRDNDGYSNLYTVTGCARPKIYYGGAFSLTFTYGKLASELTSLTQDCDDTKAAVNPGIVWYKDADNDGFSDGTTQSACYRPSLYKLSNEVITGGDCDDADSRLNPTTKWYPDLDNDGYSTGNYIVQCLRPLNGKLQTELTSITGDCNDNNAALNPATKWYKDADNDSYSDGTIKTQCTQPTSYKLATALTSISGDCNDANAALNPATIWITDADVDGYYPGIPVIRCTSPGAGFIIKSTQLAGDCSDNSASVNPAAVEVCGNGIDDNCNGVIDEATCYPCQNATGLITTSITATGAQLNWTAIANPVQWQVQYKTTKQGSKWVDVFVTGNKRSVVLSGLLSNQNYQWQIRAKCGSSWTNYSITAGFKTGGTNTLTRVAETADEMAAEPGARVYPNPTQGVFMLEMQLPENDNGTVNIQVIDLTGRILQTEIASIAKGYLKKNMSLHINLAKGIYLLRIIAGNKTYTTRLVYEK